MSIMNAQIKNCPKIGMIPVVMNGTALWSDFVRDCYRPLTLNGRLRLP